MQRVCTRSVTPTQFGKCSLGVKWDNLLFQDLSLFNTSASTCTIHEKFCWCNVCLGLNGVFIIRDRWRMFKTLWLLVAAFVAMIPAGNIVEKKTCCWQPMGWKCFYYVVCVCAWALQYTSILYVMAFAYRVCLIYTRTGLVNCQWLEMISLKQTHLSQFTLDNACRWEPIGCWYPVCKGPWAVLGPAAAVVGPKMHCCWGSVFCCDESCRSHGDKHALPTAKGLIRQTRDIDCRESLQWLGLMGICAACSWV